MTKIKCNVSSCANNKNCCCCRPDIKVGGTSAQTSSETNCKNYISNMASLQNAVAFSEPNPQTSIACEAANCTHNNNGKCYAGHITMDCCSNDTECCTFCCCK